MELKEKLSLFKKGGWKCDPLTGEIWSHKGNLCKTPNGHGYILCKMTVDKKLIKVLGHQLVWFLINGDSPSMIDHIDRNRANNRIVNLRIADSKLNARNVIGKGYSWRKDRFKWVARIIIDSGMKRLGSFDTEEESHAAYLLAKQKYHNITN